MRNVALAAAFLLLLPSSAWADPIDARVVITQADLPDCAPPSQATRLDKIALRVKNDCGGVIRVVKNPACTTCSDQDLRVDEASSGDFILTDSFPTALGTTTYQLIWTSSTSTGSIDLNLEVTPFAPDGAGGCRCLSRSSIPPAGSLGALGLLLCMGFIRGRRRTCVPYRAIVDRN